MPVKTWKLIDQAAGAPLPPQLLIGERELPGANVGVFKRTWSGGLADGVVAVEINNGKLQIDVLPTRGMGIWRVLPAGDQEVKVVGWRSPNRGPVHPAFVNLGEPSGLGWLDGFDEFLVRCGLESNGAPDFDPKTGRLTHPLHGRIANRPAHEVELTVDTDKQEMALRGVVEETRFHFFKVRMTSTITTKFGSNSFTVHDAIENISSTPATMQMLYHINFGLPLLDAGSRVVAPVKTLVPRTPHAASGLNAWDSYSAPQPGFDEMVYFLELHAAADGQTRTLLKNAHATRGVSLLFNKSQLPWFTIWKDTAGAPDGYVTGLEPGTNFPNPRSFETAKNRIVTLAPGQRQAFDVAIEIHGSPAEVANAAAAVAKIQAGRAPTIHSHPQPDWCAP